ncbi:MAG: 16S rRNA (guanine(966)-N(2))-methyltransferase RsmD [Actinobacteria bacterium]|nr:MAG: 16S rRNA (guanine(966)-N(2))-methyltransferase RsmD [Actinomycetota bacterium]TML79298.1 MAG: 16S rRNA (guanine(966)-N(2))-methyltransferase RsmD [Actinomycetota bacterium]
MRVIAGRYKGQRLKAPPGVRTRPTADRVREALFSILGNMEDLRVADLFAGSGALGIEALSRGAEHVTFVEKDHGAVGILKFNLAALGIVEDVEVFEWDSLSWLRTVNGQLAFDLVLVDPPYSSAPRLGAPLTELLPGVLTPHATIVTESDKRDPLVLDLPLDDEREYGDTRIAFHYVP